MTTIEVEIGPSGSYSVSPDPAYVKVGDYVEWLLTAHGARPYEIRWEIWFRQGSPFRGLAGPYAVSATGRPGSPEMVRSLPAQDPGDYKYGIRVIHAASGNVIKDDDPRLIVQP